MTDVTLVADRPEAGEPRPWSFPSFDRHVVEGGTILAAHLPGQPLAVLSLVVDAGAVTEPAGQEGVALLAARALCEGTQRRDGYDFSVAGERLGAQWHASADWDSLRCGFELPAGELPAAAELLAEAVREPALRSDVIDRLRDERLDELALDFSQPGPRASIGFAAELFAAGSRYAVPDGGDLRSVDGLDADAVRRFHAERFGIDTATLVLAGDLDGIDPVAIARTVFAGWSASGAPPAAPRVALRGGGRRVVFVDRPGSVQSVLYVGHDAPPRDTEDYVAMTTLGMAFGGMFNARLNLKLREEKGYAYGAFGGFECRRHGGVFTARSAVQSEVTAPALADVVAEIERVHAGGIDDGELEHARSYRAGVFPISFATPGAVASGLGDLVTHGHPDDHFDRLRAAILDVPLDEVNAAATRRIRPDEIAAVVVGDAGAVGSEVEALGLGTFTVVSDDSD